MRKRKIQSACLALATGLVPGTFALAGNGIGGSNPCYKQTWYNTSTSTGNGCRNYVLCPGRVLCGPGAVNDTPCPISTKTVHCEAWILGTQLADGTCTGGVKVGPSTTSVSVPHQNCKGGC